MIPKWFDDANGATSLAARGTRAPPSKKILLNCYGLTHQDGRWKDRKLNFDNQWGFAPAPKDLMNHHLRVTWHAENSESGHNAVISIDRSQAGIHFLPMDYTSSRWLPVVLLTFSNIFMTIAWYGHLKFKSQPLLLVIVLSWGIALFEYCFQVPANRWGSNVYSPFQLKVIQEIITLTVFMVFAGLYFHEKFRWNHFASCLCILAAVAFAFWPKAQ